MHLDASLEEQGCICDYETNKVFLAGTTNKGLETIYIFYIFYIFLHLAFCMKFLVPSHNPTVLKALFSIIFPSFFQSNYDPK